MSTFLVHSLLNFRGSLESATFLKSLPSLEPTFEQNLLAVVLRAYILAVIKCTDNIRKELQKGNIYEVYLWIIVANIGRKKMSQRIPRPWCCLRISIFLNLPSYCEKLKDSSKSSPIRIRRPKYLKPSLHDCDSGKSFWKWYQCQSHRQRHGSKI